MSTLIRIAVHLAFYPALWFNRLMCALGLWQQSDWIDDHVAVGSLPSKKDLRRLAAEGVGAVVNMCEEYSGDANALRACGLTQLHLPTLDYHCPRQKYLWDGLQFIREQIAENKKIFIHCKAGRGRSAILALCYVMATRGATASEAFTILKSRRKQLAHGLDRHPAVRRIEAQLQKTRSDNATETSA